MGLHGDALLREARDTIRPFPEQSTKSENPTATNFDQLADAVEKAIQAVLIENHGSLPAKHNHHRLVAICQNTGVWDILPPALRTLVQELEIYRATALNDRVDAAARREELKKYFGVTRRLIDYIEYHVIGNDSVLKRLKVS